MSILYFVRKNEKNIEVGGKEQEGKSQEKIHRYDQRI